MADRDLFILHADADAAFVRGALVPALGLPPARVLLSSELPPGTSMADALAHGVVSTRVTVAVVSPAFLRDAWAGHGEALAGHHALHGGLLVPLVIADCTLPLRLDFRVRLDCRDPARRAGELDRLRALLALPAPPPAELPCPYPGLRPYAADDAALFGGRVREVDTLVGLVAAGVRELYVIGPSGSGKSSLLGSGVAPRLARAGDPVVGAPFTLHAVRPGATPAARLAPVLAAVEADPARALVVIDPLEELFTLADRDARRDGLAALDRLRAIPRCHLALAVRADFQGALMQSPLWPHVRRSHRHEVEPLRGAALREAITLPARRVGVEVEPALLDRLLADAADEPGALPLIQEALVHLWSRRTHALLAAADYAALGDGAATGLAAAVARRADAGFTALDDAGQAIARRVFLRLVSFGEGRADTRRQQPLEALRAGEDPARLDAVLDHLIAHRLVTAGGDGGSGERLIDLAHETLIGAWPRLQEWIATHRRAERRRRALEEQAAEWRARADAGRGEVGLLDAGQLVDLDGWLTPEVRAELGPSADAEAFVAASRDAVAAAEAAAAARVAERIAELEVRAQIRRRWAIRATVLMVLGIVGVSILWFVARGNAVEARAQAREAEAQSRRARAASERAQARLARLYVEKAHAALAAGEGARAVPYLVEARRLGADHPVLATLYQAALPDVPAARLVHADLVKAVVWSPDGARVLTTSLDGTARVWRVADGRAGPPLAHRFLIFAAAWSPRGDRVATAGVDGVARIWDAATGAVAAPPLVHAGPVFAVAWSPHGDRLATAGWDGRVRLWDTRTWTAIERDLGGVVLALAWDPAGARLAIGGLDGVVRVWTPATGAEATPRVLREPLRSIVWSPDGTRLAAVGWSEVARVWAGEGPMIELSHDARVIALAWRDDGARLATASGADVDVWSADGAALRRIPHPAPVSAVAWRPGGDDLATACEDRQARLWPAGGGTPRRFAHEGAVWALAWRGDGAQLATAGADRTARVWDLGAGEPAATIAHDAGVELVAVSPDRARVVVAGGPGVDAVLWDLGRGAPVRRRGLAHGGRVIAVAWRPDGDRVALADDRGDVALWDVADGAPVRVTPGGRVRAVAWRADGAELATAGDDGVVRIWDAATGAARVSYAVGAAVLALAWSRDGLAIGALDGTARVWRPGEDVVPSLGHAQEVVALAWSGDGRLATASYDRTARVWDVASGHALTLQHDGPVVAVAWSPGDALLATASHDETARIWEAGTGEARASLRHGDLVTGVAWSPDGTRVLSTSWDHTAVVWDARTGQAVSAPLRHGDRPTAAAWPSDRQVITAALDGAVRLWTVSDAGDLDAWEAVLARCPEVLGDDDGLIPRRFAAPP